MAVPSINIVIENGIDFQSVFTIDNPDGTPIDLTGYTAVAAIKKFPTSTSSIPFTVGIVANAGQVVVSMANTVTSTLDTGRHYYDIISISGVGIKRKLIEGMVIVNASASV
tara:strand:+ start:1546 stop:1878 length:333 start_codon:yes stop_codon:yes gene_type:complete